MALSKQEQLELQILEAQFGDTTKDTQVSTSTQQQPLSQDRSNLAAILGAGVNVANPAAKGLSAFQDLIRMLPVLGDESASEVLDQPTDFGTGVAQEVLQPGSKALGSFARGVGSGGTFGQGENILASLQSLLPGQDFETAKAGQLERAGEFQANSPQSFEVGQLIGETIGGPGKLAQKVVGFAGKVIRKAGRLVGDLELGGRKLGEKFNRLLPKVKSIDDAVDAANRKIQTIATKKEALIAKYDSPNIELPKGGRRLKGGGTSRPMNQGDVEKLAQVYAREGNRGMQESLLKIAVKIENGGALTSSEALMLKQAINTKIYTKAGSLRGGKLTQAEQSWAQQLKNDAVKNVTNANDKLKILQADADMTDLFELIAKADKAAGRPISVSLSGFIKAVGGQPSVFNKLQTVGQGLIDTPGQLGARGAESTVRQVFDEN